MHYKVQPICTLSKCLLYIFKKNTHSCLKTSIILTSVTWFVCTRCCPAADHSCLLRMTLQNQEEIMLLFLWWQQLSVTSHFSLLNVFFVAVAQPLSLIYLFLTFTFSLSQCWSHLSIHLTSYSRRLMFYNWWILVKLTCLFFVLQE